MQRCEALCASYDSEALVVELAQSQGTLAAPEARPWLLRVSSSETAAGINKYGE